MADIPRDIHLTRRNRKRLEWSWPPFLQDVEWTLTVRNCYWEELTPRWLCFFYFNLCFPLLLFTKRILSIHSGLPWGTLPHCLSVKPKCLCLWKYPEAVHLRMAAKKKKLIHPLPEAGHSRRYLQD